MGEGSHGYGLGARSPRGKERTSLSGTDPSTRKTNRRRLMKDLCQMQARSNDESFLAFHMFKLPDGTLGIMHKARWPTMTIESNEIRELKEGSSSVVVATIEQLVVNLQGEVEQLKVELGESEYRVALAQFRAKCPDLKIKENSFTSLPEDDNVPMKEEAHFDDTLAPPEA
ncbi:hypothetical protein BHE74_00017493 [Ensete ventricosum]|nr:hypothetical protein BHE74_00017493 [Ensete ventricosum]